MDMNATFPMQITFPRQSMEAETLFQNSLTNPRRMRVQILLDETGCCLYQSDWLEPGACVRRICLSQMLPPGSHEATGLLIVEEDENHTQTSTIIVDMRLYVPA